MPHPISTTSRSVYEGLDPGMSSCEAPDTALPAAAASGPNVVSVAPVLITGDAGAQALVRQYDRHACSSELQSAQLSCPGIALGVLNVLEGGPLAGIASSLIASVLCGKDLRAAFNCEQDRAALATSRNAVIENCHEHGGVVTPGAASNEIVCQVPR